MLTVTAQLDLPLAVRPLPMPSRVLPLALALGVALAACPGPTTGGDLETLPLLTTDDADAEADLRRARETAESGDITGARELYEAFLREHPQDPLLPVAELGLGRARLELGGAEGYAEALARFEHVAQHPDPSVAARGRFWRGLALHRVGRDAEAREVLAPLVGTTIDPAETARLLETLAEADERIGDLPAALAHWDALASQPLAEAARARARTRVLAIAATEASPAQIQQAADALPHGGTAWPRVAERALREAYARNEMERVRTLADALRAEGVQLATELEAMALRAARPDAPDPAVIGAILPLSGRARDVGQQALHALMLAAGAPADLPHVAGAPQIVYRDSAGDPQRAVRAVEDLVSLHRVIAILGPIDGAEAQAAARRAQELGVPLLTLTVADGITQAGPMIFRLVPTPGGEARALVARARARGAARFAVLRPQSPYGEAMRGHFERAVVAAGGTLVMDVGYAPNATSFGREIAQLRAQPFDALFVPDTAQRLALIAPALAVAGLWPVAAGGSAPANARGLVLLAPGVAYDASLVRSSRYLQGAVIALPFDAQLAQGEARVFADRYQQTYGAPPGTYAAYAWDAFRLVRAQVEAGATQRADVAARLAQSSGAVTVGPSHGLDATRESASPARIVELTGTTWAEPL